MVQHLIKGRDAAWFALQDTLGAAAKPLDEAMNGAFARPGAVQADRPFATELAYGVVRHLLWLDYLLARHLKSGVSQTPLEILNLLRLGAYQVLFIESVPVFASVSETVNLARRVYPRASSGLINAVLRRIAEKKDEYLPSKANEKNFPNSLKFLSVRYSTPEWLVNRLIAVWGREDAERFCAANMMPAPLTVRVNSHRGSCHEFAREAASLGLTQLETLRYPPGAFNIKLFGPPAATPAFQDGWVAAQDVAAQLVSLLVEPKPGDNVADLCSAPGGKTSHLAVIAGESVTVHALDVSEQRCALVRDNAHRLRLKNINIHVKSESIMRELATKGMDRVLVDAPCSGLGVLRRNPDIKWHRKPGQIMEMARQQQSLLAEAATLVKSGGLIVYSTCTIMPEENQRVVESFLKSNPDWKLDNLHDHPVARKFAPDGSMAVGPGYLQTLPHLHGVDGFFMARMRKV